MDATTGVPEDGPEKLPWGESTTGEPANVIYCPGGKQREGTKRRQKFCKMLHSGKTEQTDYHGKKWKQFQVVACNIMLALPDLQPQTMLTLTPQ